MGVLLEGRFALVTGGGQGVGQGVVRAFADAGVSGVVIAQRNRDQGEAEAQHLRDSFGIDAHYIATDVTRRADVEAMIAATIDRFGRLDILVNNAGGSFAKRIEQHSDEDMAAALDLNYWSTFWAMRAAFPAMKAQGYGRIINMGSLNGVNAHMFTVAYNVSKEAVRALSRTAAVEWGGHGITVNVICPSSMSPAAIAYFDANPEMKTRLLEQVPIGRFGDAEQDIGPAAVFLASEGGRFTNGNTLFLGGGTHINGVSWRPQVDD
ncbi:SDR family NAD(P)-dependent oxidoreductase [Sphingomonas crocodyli]|uniref:SDR family oxidoreductase n=1 Tax=Sphingomonas crocodyli TaxID=1979270 RepID=A0A437LYL2_9SPHN|nr:SDR family oxidoreductase [Sphingomonas crocodyli]RVT90477.1 SDR family oxidoreductase [Sphingomonas crocodyli]